MIKTDLLDDLRRQLLFLRENYGVMGLKAGTETEDNSHFEIRLMHRIAKGIVPMTVKIGGPEAKNDIRFILQSGIEGVLAPMIESRYAFNNFMSCLQSLAAFSSRPLTKIAINIETKTSYEIFRDFSQDTFFDRLSHITVGRTDLAGSMELDVDDLKISRMTKNIVDWGKEKQKSTSVGGRIDHSNIVSIVDTIQPRQINTRHMILSAELASNEVNYHQRLAQAFEFEISLYQFLQQALPRKSEAFAERIAITQKRNHWHGFNGKKEKDKISA